MAKCPACRHHFRTLDDEEGMHDARFIVTAVNHFEELRDMVARYLAAARVSVAASALALQTCDAAARSLLAKLEESDSNDS